jgi:hypothetical protein
MSSVSGSAPSLAGSRTYELLAIASGKKSPEEVKVGNAERNRRHRANKKLEPAVRHVTDSKASRPPTTAEQAQAQIAKAEAVKATAEAQKARAEAVARMFPAAATKGIPSGSREPLIQALLMLASESAAERAEAAVDVERQRARLGMTWAELIVPDEVAETEVRQAA